MRDPIRYDEISGGPTGGRPRRWTFWLTTVLVAAAVAGLAWHQRRTAEPAATPRPSATARGLFVDQVCPVRTDGRRSLAVAFRLGNGLGVPVLVRGAEPVLALGGLRPVDTVMTSGDCRQPLDTRADGNLAPGGTILVIFEFDVPAGTCPRPVPVGARLTVESGGTDRTSQLQVLPDLVGVPVAACASTLMWRGQQGS